MNRILLFFFVVCSSLNAANIYVRQGASGSNNGTDWTNAYTSFPAMSSITRGDTVYVADTTSNLTMPSLNKATSGTTRITIKKATVADHGTATGWSDAFGDGQAVFNGNINSSTGYFTIDGVSRDSNWTSGYGFKIDFSEGEDGIDNSAPGMIIQYVDFDGISTTGNHNYSAGTKCITIGRGSVDLLVSRCALHGGESLMQEGDGNTGNGVDSTGTIVEYCIWYNSRSTSGSFHNNIYFISGSSGGTLRYNLVHDYNDEGFFFTGWEGSPSDWKVYGNVMWADGGEQNPRGVELRQDYDYTGILIYNNTFVNLGVGGILNRTGETGNSLSSSAAVNNLSYASPNTGMTGFQTNTSNTDDSTDRFVSLASDNFHLTAALAGTSLSATYNQDMDGLTRGSDGVWDRGAFEFNSGSSTGIQNLNVTNLRIGP